MNGVTATWLQSIKFMEWASLASPASAIFSRGFEKTSDVVVNFSDFKFLVKKNLGKLGCTLLAPLVQNPAEKCESRSIIIDFHITSKKATRFLRIVLI